MAPPPHDRLPGDKWRFVYFLRAPSTGLIKIGTTSNVRARVSGRCAEAGEALVLLASVPGGFELEGRLHSHFRDARHHSEWFEPVAELVAMTEALAAGKPVFGLPHPVALPPAAQPPRAAAVPLRSHGAELLALAVKERGVSLNEAGRSIAAPVGLVSRLLSGSRRPSRRVAIAIANKFGVPFDSWDRVSPTADTDPDMTCVVDAKAAS